MMKFYVNCLFFLWIILLPVMVLAAVPAWEIIPAQSSLSFTATQNGAPVSGKFNTFTGQINFDPDQLNASNVVIAVDMNSVNDAYNQLADTLKSADWFNVKLFPQAVFKSNSITKTGDKTFEAKGTLTIRNVTLPVTVMFTLERFTPTKAIMVGIAMLKRTAFGVGQGEWADTSAVKDDVQINFTVVAMRK